MASSFNPWLSLHSLSFWFSLFPSMLLPSFTAFSLRSWDEPDFQNSQKLFTLSRKVIKTRLVEWVCLITCIRVVGENSLEISREHWGSLEPTPKHSYPPLGKPESDPGGLLEQEEMKLETFVDRIESKIKYRTERDQKEWNEMRSYELILISSLDYMTTFCVGSHKPIAILECSRHGSL